MHVVCVLNVCVCLLVSLFVCLWWFAPVDDRVYDVDSCVRTYVCSCVERMCLLQCLHVLVNSVFPLRVCMIV